MENRKKPDLSSDELMHLFDETMKELREERGTDEAVAREFENEESETNNIAIEFWKDIFAESDSFNDVTTPVLEEKRNPIQETAEHFWSELEEETHKMKKYDLNKNFREILQIAEKERKNVEAKMIEDKAVPHKILTKTREQKQISSLNKDAKTDKKQKSDIVHKNIKSNEATNLNIPEILPFNQGAEEKKIVKKERRNRFQEHKAVINEWAVFVDQVLKEQEFDAQRPQKYETGREILVIDRLETEAVNREDEKHIQLVKCVEEDYQREQMELDNLDAVAETIAAEEIGIEEILEQIDTIQEKKKMLHSNYNKRKMSSKNRLESFRTLSPIREIPIPIFKVDKCVQTDNNMDSTSTEPIFYMQQYENDKILRICNEDNTEKTTEIDRSILQSGTAEKHSTTQSAKKKIKSDTKKTMRDISGITINVNQPSLIRDTKKKPDNIRRISNKSNKKDIKKHSVIEDKILKSDDTIPQNITMQKAEKHNMNINTKVIDNTALPHIKDNQVDIASLLKRLQEQEAVLNDWAVLIDNVHKKQDFIMQQKYEDSTKGNKDSSDKTTNSNICTLNIDTKKYISDTQIDKTQNKSDDSKKKTDKPNKTHSSLNIDAKEKSKNSRTSKVDEILKSENAINQNIQEIGQIAEKAKKDLEAELIDNKSIPHKKLTETHEHTAYTPIPYNQPAEERKQSDDEKEFRKEVCDKKLVKLENENMKTRDKVAHGKRVQLAEKDIHREQTELKKLAVVADRTAPEINTTELKNGTLYRNFLKRKLIREMRRAARRSYSDYLHPIPEEPFDSNLHSFKNNENEIKDRREQIQFKKLDVVADTSTVDLISTEEASLNNDNYENKDNKMKKKKNRKKNKKKPMHSTENTFEKTLVLNFPASNKDKESTPNTMIRKIMDKDDNKSARSLILTSTDNTASKTLDINFSNSQNNKKEENAGNDNPKEDTAYLIPSSSNSLNKTLIVNFPKFENEPDSYFQQSEDGRMVLATCNKDSIRKTTEINKPVTQTVQVKNKPDKTQKYVPIKTLIIHNSSLNKGSKQKPEYNMNDKENNPIQSLKKHEDGRIVLITCNKVNLDNTTASDMPIFQTESKNISHTQYNTTEIKSDNTQATKYLRDETMNTKSPINNNTIATKPDNNKQQEGIKENTSKNDTGGNKSSDNTKNKNKRRNRRKRNK